MAERLRDYLLPACLFLLTLAVALGLVGLVWVSPWFLAGTADDPEFLTLCAHDGTVRQTLLASALGLAITAFVFFKPPGLFTFKKKAPTKYGSPGNFAGA